MDETLRSLHANRVIDLERCRRDIRARHYQDRKGGRLSDERARILAAGYVLAHKQELRSRMILGYTPPRPMPGWVRRSLEGGYHGGDTGSTTGDLLGHYGEK